VIRSSTIAITHRIMPVLSYVAHLAIILWWLLDRSPDQSATKALVALRRQLLPSVALTPHVRTLRGFVQSANALFGKGC